MDQNIYCVIVLLTDFRPNNLMLYSKERNPNPFTGNDLSIATPSPLKNVRIPYSLYFVWAQCNDERNILSLRSYDWINVFM